MVSANSTIEEYSDIFTNFTFGFRRMLYLVTPSETTFPSLAQTPNYVELSSPWIFIFIFVEMIISKLTDRKLFQMNDSLTSTCAGLLQMTMKTFFLYVEWTTGYWLYENYRLIDLPWDSVWTWILSLLCVDLSYYWFHRAAHEINFLWCFHQIHHSSEFYNFSTAIRQGMVQQYGSMIFYLPECLFVPPQIHLAHMGLNLLYQFSVHTRLVKTLGPFELVLNTPSHHRVHHGRNPYCIDKNYGGFLIVWDRIFGTFEKERDDEPVVYGLIKPINTFDQFHCQAVHHLVYENILQFNIFSHLVVQEAHLKDLQYKKQSISKTLYFKHIWHKLWVCKSLGDIWKTMCYNPSWSPTTGQYQPVPEVEENVKPYDVTIESSMTVYTLCQVAISLFVYLLFSQCRKTLTWLQSMPYVLFAGYSCFCFSNILENKHYAIYFELSRCAIFYLWSTFATFPSALVIFWRILNVLFLLQSSFWIGRIFVDRKDLKS